LFLLDPTWSNGFDQIFDGIASGSSLFLDYSLRNAVSSQCKKRFTQR